MWESKLDGAATCLPFKWPQLLLQELKLSSLIIYYNQQYLCHFYANHSTICYSFNTIIKNLNFGSLKDKKKSSNKQKSLDEVKSFPSRNEKQ